MVSKFCVLDHLDHYHQSQKLVNTSGQVLEKTLFAINAIFTEDNNLSKIKVRGSLQKTNATCPNCKTNLILTYLRGIHLHNHKILIPRTILSDKNKFLPTISSISEIRKAMLPDGSLAVHFRKAFQAFVKCTASEWKTN